MHHYTADNGAFIKTTVELMSTQQFSLPWVDRYAKGIDENSNNNVDIEGLQGLDESVVSMLTNNMESYFGEGAFVALDLESMKKVKSKYNCSSCKINVWGKPGLALKCVTCDVLLEEIKGFNESQDEE